MQSQIVANFEGRNNLQGLGDGLMGKEFTVQYEDSTSKLSTLKARHCCTPVIPALGTKDLWVSGLVKKVISKAMESN